MKICKNKALFADNDARPKAGSLAQIKIEPIICGPFNGFYIYAGGADAHN